MSNFMDNGDGTVTDTSTGLMWKQAHEPRMTWKQAMMLKSDFAGHSDWRLPTIKELLSIVDYETHNPAIDSKVFNMPSNVWLWWSSTDTIYHIDFAWVADFTFGKSQDCNKYVNSFARLVRNAW